MQVTIMLTGTFGVGKSSLFDRLLFDRFESFYQGTVGVRTNHTVFRNKEQNTTLQIWDIAGEVDQKRVPLSYFEDKDIIFYLIDLNRPVFGENVRRDLNFLQVVTKEKTMIKIIGSKADLVSDADIAQLQKQIAPLKLDVSFSAKTGKNLDVLWEIIEKQVTKKLLWESPKQSTKL